MWSSLLNVWFEFFSLRFGALTVEKSDVVIAMDAALSPDDAEILKGGCLQHCRSF
jgi:hypothetical protein